MQDVLRRLLPADRHRLRGGRRQVLPAGADAKRRAAGREVKCCFLFFFSYIFFPTQFVFFNTQKGPRFIAALRSHPHSKSRTIIYIKPCLFVRKMDDGMNFFPTQARLGGPATDALRLPVPLHPQGSGHPPSAHARVRPHLPLRKLRDVLRLPPRPSRHHNDLHDHTLAVQGVIEYLFVCGESQTKERSELLFISSLVVYFQAQNTFQSSITASVCVRCTVDLDEIG